MNDPTGTTAKSPVLHVTDETFEREVVASEQPVFVDFWAPWCGPCRRVGPVVEELAREYEGRVKFVKLNTQDNPEVATSLGIRSIPTLLMFKGRNVVDARIGALPKEELRAMVEAALGEKKAGWLSKMFN